MPTTSREPIGGRVRAWAENNVFLVTIGLVVVLVSSSLSLAQWSISATRWISSIDDDWRQEEYRLLATLSAGTTSSIFEEALGAPLFIRGSDESTLIEKSFRRRDYWVQTVEDPTGTVIWMAVTSCDPSFQPTFDVEDGYGRWSVTLATSTLAEAIPASHGVHVSYHLPMATARRGHWEYYGASNPSLYRHHAVGISEACPRTVSFDFDALVEYDEMRANDEPASADNESLKRFRDSAVVNTYGQSSVWGDALQVREQFGFGIPFVLVRTLPEFGGGGSE